MTTRADEAASTSARILDAARDLFLDQAYDEVTLNAIARAAGVSHQTVLNHFTNKEGVVVGVAALIKEETESARYVATPGDIAGAVAALVGEYERIGDANVRWVAASERLDQVRALLDAARVSHQQWLEAVFADRLPAEATARRAVVLALHAATDVFTWKLLRRDLGLGREETEQIIAHLTAGVLPKERP